MLNSKELYGKISVWREEKGWTENKLCDMAGIIGAANLYNAPTHVQ